jgi:putative ABC transport system permease protein
MSLWTRTKNVFRGDAVNRDIDEELESHIEEAVAQGRDPAEARRALGRALALRERSRDVRLVPWLDSLRSDLIFALRHLAKNRVTAGAAIVSLALAVGACTSAFRLIDALLLRPLPVALPERLHVVAYDMPERDGKMYQGDTFDYPAFRTLRAALKNTAVLFAVSYPRRSGVIHSSGERERASVQFVSGWTFGTLGLEPVLGRLLTESDDVKPGAHPYAVLSHDYWSSRFGRDPGVIGRSFRIGDDQFQIIGVAAEKFTGTEPGTITEIFVPMTMNARAYDKADWGWFRIWASVPAGAGTEVREKLQAALTHLRAERAEGYTAFMRKHEIDSFVHARVTLEPASAGFSGLQKNYRRSLWILGSMVGLVLLVACVNVANLMMAHATARGREMALRVSIGAGRSRLIQLLLVESAVIAAVASAAGIALAWRAAPFVVGMISSPENPTRLVLPADWRVMLFAVALTALVTLLFGIVPALRASAVKPAASLKGGEDVHTRHRLMHALVAAQVAFCFVVHFVAGLFVATFDRLSSQPLGFTAGNVLVLEAASSKERPIEIWNQVTEHLKTQKGVESAALCLWPLLSGNGWGSTVWVRGEQMRVRPSLLSVSPEWFDTMRVPLLAGRGFHPADRGPGVAVVTDSFAREYFPGQNAVGKSFDRLIDKKKVSSTIVGVVGDVRYRDMREGMTPVAFFPVATEGDVGLRPKDWGSFVVRVSGDPMAVASALRTEVSRSRSEFHVVNVTTQQALADRHTVRERLLALLSLFFATTALVLAGVGLYGVLTYSVLQRRREIGIRMALGAKPADVARRVTAHVFGMLVVGAGVGLAAGIASEQYVRTLLYQVSAREWSLLTAPVVTILGVALLAALPPVIRAVRVDPALALRADG